jgi:hypothetical protein
MTPAALQVAGQSTLGQVLEMTAKRKKKYLAV